MCVPSRELQTFTFSLLVTVYACHKKVKSRKPGIITCISPALKNRKRPGTNPRPLPSEKRTTRLNAGPESIEMAGAAFLAGPDLNELRCNGDGYFLRRLGSDRQTNGSRHPGQFPVADAFLP